MKVKKLYLFFLPILIIASNTIALAQHPDEHLPPYATSISSEARYEVLRATLTPKFDIIHVYLTIKLDKFTGKTFRLEEKEGGTETWGELARLDHNNDKITNKNKTNYQIYSSGDFKSLYLLNVSTGAAWFLTVDNGKEISYWNPIE